jgi:glycerophosphoryl diester phosphodiesterase
VAALYFLPKSLLRTFNFAGRAAQIPVRKYMIQLDEQSLIDKCHALGIRVDYWVVNDQETAQRLVNLGADGVMSDDPGMIQQAFVT